MRALFFGTSPFAVPTLQALHDARTRRERPRHEILAVVTQPDRPSGRGMRLQMSPVKERALQLGYTVLQPEKVRRPPFPDTVHELAPDVLVVISFGQIIPQKILDFPRWGGINVHASLLPRWRGAAPIHHAILAGDLETGVATMQMEATLDTGPVFLSKSEPIHPDDTVVTLEPGLASLGAALLVETLDQLESAAIVANPQSERGMTYAAPVTRADGLLDPLSETADQLARRVRALIPRPGAHLLLGDREVKVWEATAVQPPVSGVPGTVIAIHKDGVDIGAAEQTTLRLLRVQPSGKPPMPAAAFANGARLVPGTSATRPPA